ncbi:MFS transporter [Porticoccaceae bacterium]|nr:MFS transporter [Porticoccaceae bacterium]
MSAEPNSHKTKTTTITKWQGIALSAPMIGYAFSIGPLGVLQGIYAKYFGMALTTLAIVLLVGRIFDVITDPLIGHFSDRFRVLRGSRKPFVLVGGLLFIPCSYFLFVPPQDVGITYFATWTLLFYLAATLLNIPMNAWVSEVSADSVERTTLFSIMVFFMRFGGMLFYFVPFLPVFATPEITPGTLKVSVLVGAVMMLLGILCALKFAPDGSLAIQENPFQKSRIQSKRNAFHELLNSVRCNKPFQIFTAAYMCSGLSVGMNGSLLFIYIDVYLGQGAIFAQLSILGMAGGLLLTPLAYKVVILTGKKIIWFISTVITLVGIFYLGLLSPGQDAYIGLVTFYIILTFGSVCTGLIAMPMLSETVDYALLGDTTEQRATYFAVLSMMIKAEMALGLAIGLGVAGWLGFDATATSHDAQSGFAIHMAVSWLPCALGSIGLYFIWRFPLDERRSAIISRRLETRNRFREQAKVDNNNELKANHKSGCSAV